MTLDARATVPPELYLDRLYDRRAALHLPTAGNEGSIGFLAKAKALEAPNILVLFDRYFKMFGHQRPGPDRCFSLRCGPDDCAFCRPPFLARRLSFANSASPVFCLAGSGFALDLVLVTDRSG
jgi:hypothetical protein